MYGIESQSAMPDPSGATLTAEVRCYTDPSHRGGRTHPILLHPNWSVDTGHDLEAERFTVAFGGYLSCLDLEAKVIPAVRTYLDRQLRGALPDVEPAVGGGWLPRRRIDRCCNSGAYENAGLAAAHWRTVTHIAVETGTRPHALKTLTAQVLTAHGLVAEQRAPRNATTLIGTSVKSRADLDLLWQAGLTPELITRVHDEAGRGRPLPANFYLGVLSRRPDLKWIHDTAAHAPDREVHTWLAWTETEDDRRHPTRRGTWLALGLSRPDIVVLSETTYAPDDVEQLATGTRRTTTAAGSLLATWVKAACFPTIPALIAICQSGEGQPNRVTRAAVDTVAELSGIPGPREHLAFALTLCGAASLAASLITATRSLQPADLLCGMAAWETDRTRRKSPVHA